MTLPKLNTTYEDGWITYQFERAHLNLYMFYHYTNITNYSKRWINSYIKFLITNHNSYVDSYYAKPWRCTNYA